MCCTYMGLELVNRFIEKWAEYVFSLFRVLNVVNSYNELKHY